MAYRRSRRTARRTRRTSRKKGTVLQQLKKYVKKELNDAVEHKCVTIGNTLLKSDETGYRIDSIGKNITNGVTDAGRIGNTIHLSRVTCRYVFSASLTTGVDVTTRWPPVTLKMFLVELKEGLPTLGSVWFKAFDRGDDDPVVPLSNDSINDGRRVINTDSFKILGAYSKTLTPSLQVPYHQFTGKFNVKLNKKLTYIHNGTADAYPYQVTPTIFLVYYFYTGFTSSAEAPELDYEMRVRTSQYFKDT
ncbi:MAG: hypothetical protein [Persevirus pargotis]|uniref:Uncharacterized protein n=1 Tax=Cressdnaviricota sp. TaxID=2748378 RepID=A0A385E6V0_9VIRU|nr:MAG: hypothetical protein [Cressdnaviricota sp.]